MITALIFVYLIMGIVFGAIAESVQPPIIGRYKILQALVNIWFMIAWLPWLFVCIWFPERDFWFKKYDP